MKLLRGDKTYLLYLAFLHLAVTRLGIPRYAMCGEAPLIFLPDGVPSLDRKFLTGICKKCPEGALLVSGIRLLRPRVKATGMSVSPSLIWGGESIPLLQEQGHRTWPMGRYSDASSEEPGHRRIVSLRHATIRRPPRRRAGLEVDKMWGSDPITYYNELGCADGGPKVSVSISDCRPRSTTEPNTATQPLVSRHKYHTSAELCIVFLAATN